MTKDEFKGRVREIVESWDASYTVDIWREYCSEADCYDDTIFSADEFDEMMEGQRPESIAMMVYYGEYNPRAPYWKFDGYGNIRSLWECDILGAIDTDAMADSLWTHGGDFGDTEISALMDELENS